MFGLFKRKSEREKLEKKYQQMLEEAYKLSHTNRQLSDAKNLEAEELRKQIDALPPES